MRPQPTLQVSQVQPSQAINGYEEFVCQFLDTDAYRNNQYDVALLMTNLVKFIHSHSAVQKVFSEEEMTALHKLVVSFEIAEKLKLGIDYVIETSERVNTQGNAETVRNVIVLIGDEPKPESRFSFNVHSAKVARLNHRAVQDGERANFEVEPDGDVVSSISCLAYLKKYTHIVGFSGTTCRGAPLAFIENQCELTVHAIPSNKESLRKDLDPITCINDQALFNALYSKLAQPRANPQLILLKDAKKLLEFKEFLAAKPALALSVNFLQGDLTTGEKERIQCCGGKEIVIATPIAERGLDLDSDNLDVTQAYACASDSREQAKGRTARNGRAGSYQQIVSKTDLPEGADLSSYQDFLDYQQIYHQALCFQKDRIKDSCLVSLFEELHRAARGVPREKIQKSIIKFIYQVESRWQTLATRLSYDAEWYFDEKHSQNLVQSEEAIAQFKQSCQELLQGINAECGISIHLDETGFVDMSDGEDEDEDESADVETSTVDGDHTSGMSRSNSDETDDTVSELPDRFKSFTKKKPQQRQNTLHRLVGEQDPELRELHSGEQGELVAGLNVSIYRHNHENFLDKIIPWDRLRKPAEQVREQASVDSLLVQIKLGFDKGTGFEHIKTKVDQFAAFLENAAEGIQQYYIERDLLPFIRKQYILNKIDFTQAEKLISTLCQHNTFSLDGELTIEQSIQALCKSRLWDRFVSQDRPPSYCINAIRQASPQMSLQAIKDLIKSRPFSSRLTRQSSVQSLYNCLLKLDDNSSPVAIQIMLDCLAIKLASEYDSAHGIQREYTSSIRFKSREADVSQRMERSIIPFVSYTLTFPKAKKQPLTYQSFVEQSEVLLKELFKHVQEIGDDEDKFNAELEDMGGHYVGFQDRGALDNKLSDLKEQRESIEEVMDLTRQEVTTVKTAMVKREIYSYDKYKPSQSLANKLLELGSDRVSKDFDCIAKRDSNLSPESRTFLQRLKNIFGRLLSGRKVQSITHSFSTLKCSFHSIAQRQRPAAEDGTHEDEQQAATSHGTV